MAEFIASVEDVKVEVDRAAKIVVNERTGTIVMGNDARLASRYPARQSVGRNSDEPARIAA